MRTSLRRVRYGRHGVGVYGYTVEGIRAVASRAGLAVEALTPLGRAGWAIHFKRADAIA